MKNRSYIFPDGALARFHNQAFGSLLDAKTLACGDCRKPLGPAWKVERDFSAARVNRSQIPVLNAGKPLQAGADGLPLLQAGKLGRQKDWGHATTRPIGRAAGGASVASRGGRHIGVSC